jgi:hypothetical protein
MLNPFRNIDPAGIALAPDGAPIYRDQRLAQASIDACAGGAHPNLAPNKACPNPESCGTNGAVCTNRANCTGQDNEFICNNKGDCKNSKNWPQCTDIFCSCPKP